MSTALLRWLRPALPVLVLLTVIGILGMHALSRDHAAHATTPGAAAHASMAAASAQPTDVSAGAAHAVGSRAHGTATPSSHPAGDSDCVPALLSVGTPISAPAATVAIAPLALYRVGAELTAREIPPPRPSLVVLSISRT
ncbi:DUF6153 family protein [Microbacterium sp. ZW T5_56]|uniref:DUF6153 family protein n=1 Tax=Microbacterium sp. ZW T5_56 TaxID=3378081 RepID=UPI003851C40F